MNVRTFLPTLLITLLGGSAIGAPLLLPTNVPGVMAYPAPPPGFDAFQASDEALAAYGLPPRPTQGNGRLRHLWEMLVRSPHTRIQPVLRPMKQTGGPFLPAGRPATRQMGASVAYSRNWSGLVLTNAAGGFGKGSFNGVAGVFDVPSGNLPFGTCNGWVRSALWTGLDGIQSSNDVLQAGVEADAYCLNEQSQVHYAAWYEWYPSNGYWVTNMSVAPGEAVLSWIIANSANSGTAILFNMATNQVVSLAVTPPAGTLLRGNSAEWILERPNYNGSLSPLMNYASAWMSSENAAELGVSGGGSFGAPQSGATPLIVTMLDDSGQTISTATPLGVNGTVFQNSGSSR